MGMTRHFLFQGCGTGAGATGRSRTPHEIFRDNGAEVFDLPSLVIGPPDDWGPLDEALQEIDTFDWIIFSSANGVRNVEERMQEINLSLEFDNILDIGRNFDL